MADQSGQFSFSDLEAEPKESSGAFSLADLEQPKARPAPFQVEGTRTDPGSVHITTPESHIGPAPHAQPNLFDSVRKFFAGDYMNGLSPETAALAKKQTPLLATAVTSTAKTAKELYDHGLTDVALNHASDAIDAALKGGEPFAIMAVPEAPVATILGAATTWMTSNAAGKIAELAHGTPAQQRFARAFTALATAGVFGTKIGKDLASNAGDFAAKAVGEVARPIILSAKMAGSNVPGGEAVAPVIRPGYHAPIEAIDAGAPSSVTPPRGSGPAETLTDIVQNAPEGTVVGDLRAKLTGEQPAPPLETNENLAPGQRTAAAPVLPPEFVAVGDEPPLPPATVAPASDLSLKTIDQVLQEQEALRQAAPPEVKAANEKAKEIVAGQFTAADVEEPPVAEAASTAEEPVPAAKTSGDYPPPPAPEAVAAARVALADEIAGYKDLSTQEVHDLLDPLNKKQAWWKKRGIPTAEDVVREEALGGELVRRRQERSAKKLQPVETLTKKQIEAELKALHERPGRTAGTGLTSDPIFTDAEKARYNELMTYAVDKNAYDHPNQQKSRTLRHADDTDPISELNDINLAAWYRDANGALSSPLLKNKWSEADEAKAVALASKLEKELTARGYDFKAETFPEKAAAPAVEEAPVSAGYGAVATYKPGDRVESGTASGTVTAMLDPTGRVADRRVEVSFDGGQKKRLALHLLRPLPPDSDGKVWRRLDDQWEAVKGGPVTIKAAPEHEFSAFSDPKNKGVWHVIENTTGLSVGSGNSKAGAIGVAEGQIAKAGTEKFNTILAKARENTPPLPTAAPKRKVKEVTDEGSAVSGDRTALAGTPATDGQEPRSEEPSGPDAGVRGAEDVGSGEQPDAVGDASAGRLGRGEAGLGVPPVGEGTAGAAERATRALDGPADFVIGRDEQLAIGGARERVTRNLEAVTTLKQIEGENRLATAAEQEILARYVGWGGLANVFKETDKDFARVKDALTEDEYRAARRSTPNAHFTSPKVIAAMYDALAHLGVTGPVRFLEPAAGVGHFLGLMPREMAAMATRHAVELDSISARITKALYPNAKVQQKGFEQTKLPNTFDLVVSNIPFGNYQIADPTFKGRPKALTGAIHNYFFAKALDVTRPGGIIAFITSHHTLDEHDSTVRNYLANHADFLGAIRLPYVAFRGNAGTEVVTDIIFLKKREADAPSMDREWVNAQAMELPTKDGRDVPQYVNDYFTGHPRMVLGRQDSSGKMYGRPDSYNVVPPGDTDAERQAHWEQHGPEQISAAIAQLPTGVYKPPTREAPKPEDVLPTTSTPEGSRDGSFFEKDGKIFVNREGVGFEQKLSPDAIARIRGLMKIRDTLSETMRLMLDPSGTDAQIKKSQATLNKVYDAFVQKQGFLKLPKNVRAFSEDPDVYTVLALEEWGPKATKPEKAGIFTKRTLKPSTPVEHVETSKEALLVSLNETGQIHWPRMSALTGISEHDLKLELEGLVFENPDTKTWEHADLYLSGNVKAKLKLAEQAGDRYKLNVEALKQVQPKDLEPQDISVRLGAPWLPPETMNEFTRHLGLAGLKFKYSPALAKWFMDSDRFNSYTAQNREQWGTPRAEGHKLLISAMNMGDPVVYDTVSDGKGGTKSVVNQQETIAAREKQQALQDEFKAWIWNDGPRAVKLARIYNDVMNTMQPWNPDGSHLTLDGLAAGIKLRPHQKNFIWRALQSMNALAHHVVGAGKTYAGIAIAMEKRRLGLARKPMVVVPNHLPKQWAKDIKKLYPAAKVLVALEKKDFEPQNRKRFLSRIATGDWDVVIVPYSHFGRIKVSDETFNNYLMKELETLDVEIKRARAEAGKGDPTVKELEKAKLNLEAKLRTAKEGQKKDEGLLTFEQLGVDHLIIDEAHNFKKLFVPTKMTRVAGVPSGKGSDRAFDLFIKMRHIEAANATGGTVFLTGTPISNTMVEMFILMRYLAQKQLEARGIGQLDGWAATFGEKVSAFEISPTGRGFRQKTRFARFTNMPELMQMYRAFADVQTADMLKLPTPPLKGGKAELHVIPATAELDAYVETLLDRYEHVLGRKQPKPDPSEDNPLKITGDGRKAALDLRLVGAYQPEGGKVDVSTAKIYEIWKREGKRLGTQLVFADLGTPSKKKGKKKKVVEDEEEKFPLYQAIRDALVAKGIPVEQIAFIQEAKTDAQKESLFESMRAGAVRVLLGSTETMGAGTNVQDRLVALHHLDAPWRPSDIEQREGRILRQGNLFGDKELNSPHYDPKFEVEIHTYLSERSFDAYLWQLLESKARFIMQALKGDGTSREMDDADDVVMSFGAAKAIATGNPAIMEHAKAQSDLARLEISEASFVKRRFRLQAQLAHLPQEIQGWEEREAESQLLLDAIKLPAERKDLAIEVIDKATGQPRQLTGEGATARVLAALEESQKGRKTQIDAYHTSTPPATVGTVSGVEVRVSTSTSFVGEKPVVTSHWTLAKGDAMLSRPATIGDGAMASLANFMENGPKNELFKATSQLESLRSSLETAKAEVIKPYPHADAIKTLRDRIKELEKSLNLDAASQQAEAAAAGTIVQSAEEEAADAAAERGEDDEDDEDPDGGDDVTRAGKPPTKKGITLQSTVLPGAKEFGEYVVDPAVKMASEAIVQEVNLLKRTFTPATVSDSAIYAAGTMRARFAEKDMLIGRLHRNHAIIKKMMDGWSHDQSLAFWDVMQGLEPIGTLPTEIQKIAEAFRVILDYWTEQVTSRGLIKNYLEHYWPQEWERNENAVTKALQMFIGRRPLAGPESYRKRRSIPNTREGVQEYGLTPKSWNPAEQLARKVTEMARSVMAYDIRKDLQKQGFRKFVPEGQVRKKKPQGWVEDKDRGVVYGPQSFKTQTGEEARVPFGRLVAGRYYLQPDVARLLENHLSPGLAGKSVLFDLYRVLGNVTSQVLLGWSSFHLWLTGIEGVLSKATLVSELMARGELAEAAKASRWVGPHGLVRDIVRGTRAINAFYGDVADAGDVTTMIGQIINAGGGFGWNEFEHENAPEKFMADLRGFVGALKRLDAKQAAKSAGMAAARSPLAAIELPTSLIMNHWVPALKASAFLDLAQMEMRRLGKDASLEEQRRVLAEAWDAVDDRFGQLRRDNLFWNRALDQLLTGAFLSITWNVGSLRHGVMAVPAQIRRIAEKAGGGGGGGKPPINMAPAGTGPDGEPRYAKNDPWLHRRMAWLLTSAVLVGLAGALRQYLMTGKRPGQEAEGTADYPRQVMRDLYAPRNGQVGANGREERDWFITYAKDYFAWATHPVTTLEGKVKPFLKELYEVITNRDFFDNAFRENDIPENLTDVTDTIKHILKSERPIAWQKAQQRAGEGATFNQQLEEWLKLQVSPFTPASAAFERSDAETLMRRLLPPTPKSKQQAEDAELKRQVRAAVQTGAGTENVESALEEGKLTAKQYKAIVKSVQFTALQANFKKLTLSDAIKVYTVATPDERASLLGVMQKKIQTGMKAASPQQRESLANRLDAISSLPYTTEPAEQPAAH